MNRKDIVILLIFLLAVLGLIIGAYYTQSADSNLNDDPNEKIVYDDSNGEISITIEPEKRKETFMDKILDLTQD